MSSSPLTLEETRTFDGQLDAYEDAKTRLLELWRAGDCKQLLTLDACKRDWPSHLEPVLDPCYKFLQSHGLINFGLAKEPEDPVKNEEPEKPTKVGKRQIIERLYAILRTADLETTSEKRIRQQLASELGVPMDEHKAFVRKHVMHVIDHMDERETLEPLPYTDDEDEEDGAGGKGRKAKGKGKEQPHVVVVGAGPAGLAAATVLQRNGVKVTVLEALPHVGGRLARLTAEQPVAAAGAAAAGKDGANAADPIPPTTQAALAALGPTALMFPPSSTAGARQLPAASSAAAGSLKSATASAGIAALHALRHQLELKSVPLAETPAGLRPALLYTAGQAGAEGKGSDGGGEDSAAAERRGSYVPEDVQAEAEGLLREMLDLARQRLEVKQQAQDSPSGQRRPTLGSELRAALRQLQGLPPAEGPEQGEGQAGGAGAKRPAAEGAADASLEDEDGADGASRPAKRGRATVLGADSDEEEGPAGKEKQDTKGEGQGAVEQADQQQQQPDANGVKEEVEGAAGGGGSGAAVKSKGEGGALEGSGPNGGRMIRPEVLRALHSHLLPLLELQLGAPLDALALHQLRLLPPLPACVLPAPTAAAADGDSKAGEEAGAAQGPQGAEGWAVLPGGVRAMCEALAAGLEDVRTGVVVTAVAATAAGVRVTCKSGSPINASAAILAVPHSALRPGGGISLDPPLPPYKAAAACRLSYTCQTRVVLQLPTDDDQGRVLELLGRMLLGGRPVVLAGAEAGAGAADTAAGAGGKAGQLAPGTVVCPAGPEGLVGVLLPVSATTVKASLTEEKLKDAAIAALQAALSAAVASNARAAAAAAAAAGRTPTPVAEAPAVPEPVWWRAERWPAPGQAGGACAALGPAGSGAAAGAAAGVFGDERDMQLLALPSKGKVFFAGEHTAPDTLPCGLLPALLASGLREAARAIKALQPPAGDKAGSRSSKAAPALEVADEPPHDKLIADANAALAAAEKAAKVAKAAAGKAAKAQAAGARGKAKGEDVEDEVEDEDEGVRNGRKRGRRVQAVSDEENLEDSDAEAPVAAKKQRGSKGAAKKRSGEEEEEDEDEEAGGRQQGGKGKGKAAGDKGAAGSEGGDEESIGTALEDSDDEDGEEEEEGPKGGRAARTRKAARSESGSEEPEEEEGKAGKKKKGKEKGKGVRGKGKGGDGDGGGSEEEEDEEGGRERGGKGKGGKERRRRHKEEETEEERQQMGLLDKQRRAQQLAKLTADRKDVKVLYKAMMSAGNGNLGPLKEQLSSCAGLDAKQQVLHVLQGASVAVLQLMAGDGTLLQIFADWLHELCDEMSAEHLVMSQLRLMERLPLAVEPPGAAAGDGDGDGEGEGGRGAAAAPGTPAALAAAVRSRCWAHRSKDVKALGARVVATWERRAAMNANFRGAHGAPVPSAAGPPGAAAGADRPAAAKPGGFNLASMVALRATPPPSAAAAAPRSGGGAVVAGSTATGAGTTAAGSGGGAAQQQQQRPPRSTAERGMTPPPGATGDVPKPDSGSAVPLDPEIEGKLRAVKEAAENARREAAAAAQRRAEVLQEAGGAIPGAAGAAAGGSAGAGGAGAARPAALPEIATFEDFKRTERGGGKGHHHREGGSSKKSSSSASVDPEVLKTAVTDYTKQVLKGYHKAGKISSSAFRLILDKASRKVLESLTAAGGGRGVGLAPDGRSLDVKRKDKIKVLVEQYVKKHGNAAASGGSGAPGASSAGGSMQPQPPPPPLGGSSGASAGVAPAPPAAPPPAPPPPPPPPPAAPVMQQPGASVMPPQLPGLMPPGLGPAPLGMAQGGMMVPTGFGVPPGLGMPSGAFPGMVQQGLPAAMPPGLMGSGPGGGGFDPHARVAQPPPPPPPQY